MLGHALRLLGASSGPRLHTDLAACDAYETGSGRGQGSLPDAGRRRRRRSHDAGAPGREARRGDQGRAARDPARLRAHADGRAAGRHPGCPCPVFRRAPRPSPTTSSAAASGRQAAPSQAMVDKCSPITAAANTTATAGSTTVAAIPDVAVRVESHPIEIADVRERRRAAPKYSSSRPSGSTAPGGRLRRLAPSLKATGASIAAPSAKPNVTACKGWMRRASDRARIERHAKAIAARTAAARPARSEWPGASAARPLPSATSTSPAVAKTIVPSVQVDGFCRRNRAEPAATSSGGREVATSAVSARPSRSKPRNRPSW